MRIIRANDGLHTQLLSISLKIKRKKICIYRSLQGTNEVSMKKKRHFFGTIFREKIIIKIVLKRAKNIFSKILYETENFLYDFMFLSRKFRFFFSTRETRVTRHAEAIALSQSPSASPAPFSSRCAPFNQQHFPLSRFKFFVLK